MGNGVVTHEVFQMVAVLIQLVEQSWIDQLGERLQSLLERPVAFSPRNKRR